MKGTRDMEKTWSTICDGMYGGESSHKLKKRQNSVDADLAQAFIRPTFTYLNEFVKRDGLLKGDLHNLAVLDHPGQFIVQISSDEELETSENSDE